MLTPFDSRPYLEMIHRGLEPQRAESKTIIVVGAGMAGLVASYELQRAGHRVVILEGQGRVGGRIFTMREPFAPGLYGEAGAMRIPRSHDLTMAYIEKFALPTADFTMGNPNAYCHYNGKKQHLSEVERDPSLLPFETAPAEVGMTAAKMWEAALDPVVSKIKTDGWEAVYKEYDQYSVREFLEDVNGWSQGAIEMFGLLFNQESLMNSSFLELLREEIGNYYTNMVYLKGGTDALPLAFLPDLKQNIHFGAKMTAIDQDADHVTVHYQTHAGRRSATGDYAILTVPFPVLRHVEVLKPFSRPKQRAIRQLKYDASAKIFLQCRRRFWEEDEDIIGGGSTTDLAVRNVYYPDHGRETGRGVLLASYTWSEDAQRWGSLAPHDRISQAIENVAQIHPQIIEEFEVGASWMWHDDEFAGGAFALFDPGQQTGLHEHIIAPEGRIHFAGEHASLSHAWIQGAIESGLRAAADTHQEP